MSRRRPVRARRFEVTRYGIDDLDRAIADSEAEGYVKLITSPAGKILGVTIVGDHAGDLIHEYILAMKKGVSVEGDFVHHS